LNNNNNFFEKKNMKEMSHKLFMRSN